MFPQAAPTGPTRPTLPPAAPVSNWSVALYRKAEPVPSATISALPFAYDQSQQQQPTASQQTYGSFYVQLQHQADPSSPSRSDVLYFRYQAQQYRNSAHMYTLPFTISLMSDMKLSPDTAPLSATASPSASRFYNAEQQSIRGPGDQSEPPPTLMLRAKAFLGVLVLNSATSSITANTAGIARPFLIFVTDDVFIGQLFDVYIYRITQVGTISMRDNPEDETFVAGIKKLFQVRCFYYATFFEPKFNNNKRYFDKPYDITLCAQRMVQGHDSDIRFFWNRGLCLPLLKFNIDIRYWIPKVMCGGIEMYRNQNDELELWVISRLSCERAGTRFNVRGVNDDGAVANFVETEQVVLLPRQNHYSSFVIVRGSIPIFWHQPRFQVGTHRITISRSEALSFKAFFEHFKHLYRHYGRVLILNLVEKRDHEERVGDEYRKLFLLLVKIYQQNQKKQKPPLGHIHERDFIWFDYHEQARTIKNLTPEDFVGKMLIHNSQYQVEQALEQAGVFTYTNEGVQSVQQGVFRVNCIDCLDRTNNVQLTIGMEILPVQLASLKRTHNRTNLLDHLRTMWINNGDHISRIYTGTGALGQRSKAKDIQRSVGRAIQNNLRDDEKQQSIQTIIYSYAKDSYLHERSVAALLTPYVISDGFILGELFALRSRYVKKETIRISLGTWNINGDKNPALDSEYPSILDAWILDGPENSSAKTRKENAIPTIGLVTDDYKKTMPDILAIGFQEICDLTATNMVWQSSVNATRWVDNVNAHFKKAYPNDEYILLGNDQLVGVCLAIFIRRDLAPFVKNIVVDSVKTGMGGKIGNKGCVAIRLVLYSTSICFVCAHFTAGQNEVAERNKDYKSIMEKLSFQAPSRALWHDHIFFLGDFNYRLTIPRNQVEQFVKNEAYKELLEYDQLKKEHSENRVFREFNEGTVLFPPTYKYDIGKDDYDTSEKARTPSYTDRILWRSIFPNVKTNLLYYGRAEVKTSDHRPVSAMFDVEVEICDETAMHQEYVNIYQRFSPSNAQIVYEMRAELVGRKFQLIEEFDAYVKQTYGQQCRIMDRFFFSNQHSLSLNMFFENGEQARRVMNPVEDKFVTSGVYFRKRLVMNQEEFSIAQKLNLLFADADETMYPESIAHDLGAYQQPASDSLSTLQDVTVAGVVAEEYKVNPAASSSSVLTEEENQQQKDEDLAALHLIDDAHRTFEYRRRTRGDIFASDSDDEDEKTATKIAPSSPSSLTPNGDSDLSTNTDTDSPYGSDSESSSSYDKYYAERKIPKKKLHGSHKGPVKQYLEEIVGNWPKYRYRKYKRHKMRRHGIQINYGNVQTHQIKRSLKREKLARKREQQAAPNLTLLIEGIVRETTFLSLDPEHPLTPTEVIKSESLPEDDETKSNMKSKLNKMTKKFAKSLKRKKKPSSNQVESGEQSDSNSHAASDGEEQQQEEIGSDLANEDALLTGGGSDTDDGRQVGELISLEPYDEPSLSRPLSDNNLQGQAIESLFDKDHFDPFHFASKSTSNNVDSNNGNLFAFDQHAPSTNSTFYIDPFDIVALPAHKTISEPLPILSSNSLSNNSNKLFYDQPRPTFIPTRPPPPIPIASTMQRPLTLKNLNLNSNNSNNDLIPDLVDLGDPGSPPPSPKFDPFG